MEVIQFISTKAFIIHQDKVLILRESKDYEDGVNEGKYEIPGGRVESDQRFSESLLREVLEETGLTINIGRPFYVGEWHPVIKGKKCQIVAIFFECSSNSDEVILSKDHDKYLWIDPRDYKNYEMPSGSQNAFVEFLKTFEFK
jgi:8-oxo-dGTP diphosphatase